MDGQRFAFTDEIGRALHPQQVSDQFYLLSSQAGLPPVQLHDLRHGAASIMLAVGVDLKAESGAALLNTAAADAQSARLVTLPNHIGDWSRALLWSTVGSVSGLGKGVIARTGLRALHKGEAVVLGDTWYVERIVDPVWFPPQRPSAAVHTQPGRPTRSRTPVPPIRWT